MNEKQHPFWEAVLSNDTAAAMQQLENEPGLAATNFAPESLHTEGFPLYHASKNLNATLVKAFLEAGADPDAKIEDDDDPRERGMPLLHAFEQAKGTGKRDYSIVHLILDHKPVLHAFPYCSTPFVDVLFNSLWDSQLSYQAGDVWRYEDDLEKEIELLFCDAFSDYLRDDSGSIVGQRAGGPTASESSTGKAASPEYDLLKRVIEMGGQPSFFTLVRHERHDLIRTLLQKCPLADGTPMDWPRGTVFDNICNAASWCGYPTTIHDCMTLCDSHFSPAVAIHVIDRAIRSHNRDGDIDQYEELMESQLQYLKLHREGLAAVEVDFLPFHWLAQDYVEQSHYGFKCARLGTEDDLIRLAKLFARYGMNQKATDPKTEETAIEIAKRNGFSQYAAYLDT